MPNRAVLIALFLPLFVGALVVTAIVADRQSRQGPERIETVRYVTSEPEIETRVVYVDRIVEKVVEVPVETRVQEAVVVSAPTVVWITPVTPPPPEPAIVPLVEPPAVVLAVCDPPGRGVGRAVGYCRKQGFP